MKNLITNEQLKQYLLKTLTDDAAEIIDLRIISDKDFEEKMIIAEETLMEDYIEGELSENDRLLFQNNFLISEERIERLEILIQLKQFAQSNQIVEIKKVEIKKDEANFFQRLRRLLIFQPATGFILIVCFGLIGSLIWFNFFSNSNNSSKLEIETTKLNKEDFTDVSKYQDFQKLVLFNGQTRSIGKTNELSREKLSEYIFVNLALRTETKANEQYNIELIKDKKIVFRLENLPAYNNGVGEELRFLLPSNILGIGQYQIQIKSNINEQNKLNYTFVVK